MLFLLTLTSLGFLGFLSYDVFAEPTFTLEWDGTSQHDNTVNVGDTIAWEWIGLQHNLVWDDETGVPLPDPSFGFPDIVDEPNTYAFTFTEPGEYYYHCTIHSEQSGVVTVLPSPITLEWDGTSQHDNTVNVGDTIAWEWIGLQHNLVWDDETGVPLPDPSFGFPDIVDEPNTYAFTFTEPGEYNYHCTVHEEQFGVVIVESSEEPVLAWAGSSQHDNTVNVGDTLTWEWGGNSHNLVWDPESGVPLPDPSFGFPDIVNAPNTYAFTFTEPGQYFYHCEVHSQQFGVVTVLPPASWPNWGGDLSNTKNASTESQLSPDNIDALIEDWIYTTDGSVVSFVTVQGNDAYFVSRVTPDGQSFPAADAMLNSINRITGELNWAFPISSYVESSSNPSLVNDDARVSPAIQDDILVVGTQYAANGATVFAVDRNTGDELWETAVDDHIYSIITSSPTIYQDRVYVGVSSLEELWAGITQDPRWVWSTEVLWQNPRVRAIA